MRSYTPGLLRVSLWCLGLALTGCPSPQIASLCLQDSDCPQACRNGQCVEFPRPESAAFCEVIPDFVIGRPGTRVRFDIDVRDAAGEPLVLGDGISWTAATPTVTGGGEGRSATFMLSMPGSEKAVEARVANASCRAHVKVLSEGVPEGQVRVLVTDELTGRPIKGALVAVADSEGSITSSSRTDRFGVARVAATGVVSLNVFHSHFGYLTLTHYDTGTGSRDLSLPLRRNPLDLYGGARISFRDPPRSSEILMGFAGLSAPALGLDVGGRQISGPATSEEEFDFRGKKYRLRMSSSMYLALGARVIKAESIVPGIASRCDAGIAGFAVTSNTCGRRISWALTGEVPLTTLIQREPDIKPSIIQVLADNPDLLRQFHSSVTHDVKFRLKLFDRDFEDTEHFTRVEHAFEQMPLSLHFDVSVPRTPSSNGFPLDDISLTSVVDVAGQGMVLLGLGFAKRDNSSDRQVVRVFTAPAHHGLEGNPYRLIVSATSLSTLTIHENGNASTHLIGSLRDGLSGLQSGKPLDLGPFLPIPMNARYNFHGERSGDLEGRQFRFLDGTPSLPGATLLRILFTDGLDHVWTVLLDPAQALEGFRLPVPPESFDDRTRYDRERTLRSEMLVQALSVRNADGLALGPTALAEATEVGLTRLMEFTQALSHLNYDRPEVIWVVPHAEDEEGGTIQIGSTVRVRVSDFRVSSDPQDDGHVRLTFQGGQGCEGVALYRDVVATLEHGEVDFKLPPGCHGQRVSMTATLVDSRSVPLTPVVSATCVANILP